MQAGISLCLCAVAEMRLELLILDPSIIFVRRFRKVPRTTMANVFLETDLSAS